MSEGERDASALAAFSRDAWLGGYAAAREQAAKVAEAEERGGIHCTPAYPDKWEPAHLDHYEGGQIDASASIASAIRSMEPEEKK